MKLELSMLPTLLTLLAPLILAQQALLPNTLPACAGSCAILQNAQTSCQSNPAAETSCFCQSALLSPLYADSGAQLCPTCTPADIQAIESWYQGFCKNPTAPNANAPNNPTPTASVAASQPATSKATSTPSGATVTGANQQSTTNGNQGPWFSTHWRWVVMLIVLAIGLTLIGIVGTIWHRRYHRKREARFTGTLGLPNINTWGPGQSVHDLGFTNGSAAPYQEKGKAKAQTRRVDEPAPARMREMGRGDKI